MTIFLQDLSFELPGGAAASAALKPLRTTLDARITRAADGTVRLQAKARAISADHLDVFIAEVTYAGLFESDLPDDEAAQLMVPFVMAELGVLTHKSGLGALSLPWPWLPRQAVVPPA